MGEVLIKSRERVKKFAEVFTPKNIVNDMLDLVGDIDVDTTFLEPACGNGNFVVEILGRKFAKCRNNSDVIDALKSVYGVDIQADNVVECKKRIWDMLDDFDLKLGDTVAAAVVINCNIQQGDFLAMKKADGSPLEFVDWRKK